MGRALLTTLATLLVLGGTALLLRADLGGPDLPALAAVRAFDLAAWGTALRLLVWAVLALLLVLLVLRVTVALALLFGAGYAPLAYLGQALLLPVMRRTAGGLTAGIMLTSQLAGGSGLATAAGSAGAAGHGAGHVLALSLAGRQTAPPPQPRRQAAPPSHQGRAGRNAARRMLARATARRTSSFVYTVQPGDSLSLIASHFYGDLQAYPRLFRANRGRPQADGGRLNDPWLLQPGWRLLIPLPSPVVTLAGPGDLRYVVQEGDTLDKIAAALLGHWERYTEIVRLNAGHAQADGGALGDPNLLRVGWVLRLPAEGAIMPLSRTTAPHPAAALRRQAHRQAVVLRLRAPHVGRRPRGLNGRPPASTTAASTTAASRPPISTAAGMTPRAVDLIAPPRGHPRPFPLRSVSSPPTTPRLISVPRPGQRQGPRRGTPHEQPGRPPRGRPPLSLLETPGDEEVSPRVIQARPTPRSLPLVRLSDGRLLPTTLAATFLTLLALAAWRRGRRRTPAPTPLAVVAGAWPGVRGGLAAALAGRLRGDEQPRSVPVARALATALRERGLGRLDVRWVREGEETLTLALATSGDTAEALLRTEEDLSAQLGCPVGIQTDPEGVVLTLRQAPVALWSAAAGTGGPHPVPLLVGLGAATDGQALHVNLAHAAPLLVASSAAGGSQTVLLTLLTHLAAQAGPPQLQLLIVADPGGMLAMLRSLPHLIAPLADPTDPVAVAALLDQADEELDERTAGVQAAGSSPPALVVAVDYLEELRGSPDLLTRLMTLARDGRGVGIYVLATTEDAPALADAGVLDAFPGRLTLRLPGEEESRQMVGEAGAETLGQGEALWRGDGAAPERLHAFALAASEAREMAAAIVAAGPPDAPASDEVATHGDGPDAQDAGTAEMAEEEDTEEAPTGAVASAAAPSMATHLVTLHLLRDGLLGLAVAGRPVADGNDGLAGQPRELLAYLALQRGRPVPRDRILEALWPDHDPAKSISSFHKALHRLRKGLTAQAGMPPGLMIVTERQGEYLLAPEAVWVDALAFEEALDDAARATQAGQEDRHGALLRRALDLYGGALLGDQVPDWAAEERRRLHDRYLDAVRALSTWHEGHGDLASALVLALRLADADPLTEAYHRRVMRLQGQSGDHDAVQRRYALLCDILRTELRASPSKLTQAVYARSMEQEEAVS